MRKNATKLAAAVLSLAMVMTSVSMPASAATTKKAKLNKTKATLYTNGTKTTTLKVLVGKKSVKATFKSSNTKILTVGKTTGKVTAKKNGTATVTATYKKKAYKCKITVKTYATSITSSTKTINLEVGKTATIKKSSVKVLPSTASNKTFNFTSSNKSVATVGLTGGKVTAKKKGTAKIFVTALGSKGKAKKATITVNVTEPDVTPTETPSVTPGVTETPVPTETPSVATEGTISVTTNITGASITIMDGSKVVASGSAVDGKPFTTGKIPNGTYVVTVSKEGYKPETKNIVVNGDDVKVDAPLELANSEDVKAELKGAYRTGEKSVQVNFTNKIKDPSKDNFSIEGLTVSDVKLSQDQKSVILTVSGMETDKTYTVKTKNIVDANGAAVADGTADFVARKITYVAKMEIVDTKDENVSRTELKSDGKDSAKVVITLTTDAGEVVKDEEAEITFSTTAGNFAETKVAVQNGVATNLFTSENSATKKEALLTATVTASSNDKLLNVKAERTISMNPNIESEKDETVGVSLTDAMVETCDRVILFFNKDVNVTDYTKNDTDNKFAYDSSKMSITIKDNVKPNGKYSDTKSVMALAEVPGNTKALYAILQEGDYLTDNSKLEVKVGDKTKSIKTDVTKTAFVSDIRTPSILNVTNPNKSLKTINVIFSEPIQRNVNGGQNPADKLEKWVIDNTALSDAKYGYGTNQAHVEVGKFDVKNGKDERNVVTITLGKNSDNKQIYFPAGSHSVQGNKIGDWANMTDVNNNLINTQTLDFTIDANNEAPAATVTVESPEQYDVKFNTIVNANDVKDNLKLQQYKNGSWVDLTKADYAIRKVGTDTDSDASEYIVELTRDWTKILNTDSTRENYYNYDFRLHLDKEKVYNAANGLPNTEINSSLNDEMKNPDVTSPKLADVQQKDNTSIEITMSEPVQITGFEKEGHQITPKDEQGNELSRPIIQFISSDNKKTVKGKISKVDDHDKVLTVKPDSDMEAGTWKVVLRNISDDIGNTAETLKQDFVVTGTIKADSGFKALWVVAVPSSAKIDPIAKERVDVNKDRVIDNDVIYVKFNKQIKTSGGADNAGSTTNYTVDGYTVPSTSKIDSAVEGYNAVANRKNNYNDLVAIYLPKGTLNDSSKSHTINISDTIKSYTGAKLENGGLKLLSYVGDEKGFFTWGYATYKMPSDKTSLKVSELQAVFDKDDESYAEFKLSSVKIDSTDKATKKFTLTHTASYDFMNFDNDATGKGEVDELIINTKETGVLNVSNVEAKKITINAPNADVKLNGVDVEKGTSEVLGAGTLEVVDILDGTLTINGGTIDNLKITDSNAGAVNLTNSAKINAMEIDTTGKITLDIADDVNLPDKVTVKKVCTLNIESDKNVALELDASIKVDDMKISSTGDGAVKATVKEKEDVTVPVKKDVVVTTPVKAATNTSFSVNAGKVDGSAKAGVIEVTVSVATGSATVTTKASIEVKNNDGSDAIANNIRTKLSEIIKNEPVMIGDTKNYLKDAIEVKNGSDNTVVIALINNSIATDAPIVKVKYTPATK